MTFAGMIDREPALHALEHLPLIQLRGVENVVRTARADEDDEELDEPFSFWNMAPEPLRERVIGVFNCYTGEPHRFSGEEVALLTTVANQTALAIENARLVTNAAVVREMHHRIKNNLQSVAMLLRLSGRTHEVLTGVAVVAEQVHYRLNLSRVTLRNISPQEAAAYWATGEPADKAGGYAIQGLAAVFVERIEGSYSGIMGLPLFETMQILAAIGVQSRWRP